MANQNPAWLNAMLLQMYPGGSADTGFGGTGGTGDPANPWNKAMPGVNAGPGRIPEMQTPIQGVDPRLVPAGPGVLPPRGIHSPVGNPSSTPAPDATRVGGAPSPGVPAPQNFNRASNNPPFAVPIQYGVPGSGRGGANLIYTALNLGGQQNAPQAPPSPKGALAANAPQAAPGPGLNAGGIFGGLPANFFGGKGGVSDPSQLSYGDIYGNDPAQPWINENMANYPGHIAVSPDQLASYMSTQPWLRNLGG